MNQELSSFAARFREVILSEGRVPRGPNSATRNPQSAMEDGGSRSSPLRNFNLLALELFALQFKSNPAYRKICTARKLTPDVVEHWTQIPAVPTAAFKELELSCIPPAERTAVFYSSGTTEQKPSRHCHCAESLKVYEASLSACFFANVLPDLRFTIYDLRAEEKSARHTPHSAIFLTPPPEQAPHSSLVHMFETIRKQLGRHFGVPSRTARDGRVNAELQTEETAGSAAFFGKVAADGSWALDFDVILGKLNSSLVTRHSSLLLGTAFSFVHLLDYLAEKQLSFQLPPGSRVMETGGYKDRSRSMPRAELHALIAERLGVPQTHIVCEYGMSELSSQAYDSALHPPSSILHHRAFRFPPWARAQIISPETGREVADGETGLLRVFDLANVFSALAVQTEDLGIRCGKGFELVGRARFTEPRGCSLMMNEPLAPALSPPGGERVAEGRVRG